MPNVSAPLEPQRYAARSALYGALLLCSVVTLPLLWLVAIRPHVDSSLEWVGTEWEELLEVRLLQEYMRIDTTSDHGNELEGARWFAAQLAEIGIEAEIEEIDERHANVIAVIEGDDPAALILHHHIDTDSVGNPDLWRYPPFAAVIEGPWIFGRGGYDMKSVAVAQLMAVRDLVSRGRPKRRVVLIATSSEESGSDLGMDRVVRLRPELFDGAFAFLSEGGFVEPSSLDEVKYWAIEVGQKGYVWIELCHSDPNLLQVVGEAIDARSKPLDQLRVDPIVEEYLEVYNNTRTWGELGARLADPKALVTDLATFQRVPPVFRALFRSESSVFWPIRPAAGGGHRLEVSLQLLPGDELAEALERFLPQHLVGDVAMAFDIGPPSLVSPRDHPAFREMVQVLRARHLEVTAGMAYLPWTATDSRFVRRIGVPAYGFSPFLVFASDTFKMSGANEKLGLPGYVSGVELYVELVRRLAG